MAGEKAKETESGTSEEVSPPAAPAAPQETLEAPKDVAAEKTVIPPSSSSTDGKPQHSKTVAVVEKTPESITEEKSTDDGNTNRDAVLARVETAKRISLIKAWEESEKSKAENKAHKKLSSILSWENRKKASVEAELKNIEEKLERKKAEYAEKMKNKVALIHKEAEEKRAIIEAKRGEDLLKAEELAAKYRTTGKGPKRFLGCFSLYSLHIY